MNFDFIKRFEDSFTGSGLDSSAYLGDLSNVLKQQYDQNFDTVTTISNVVAEIAAYGINDVSVNTWDSLLSIRDWTTADRLCLTTPFNASAIWGEFNSSSVFDIYDLYFFGVKVIQFYKENGHCTFWYKYQVDSDFKFLDGQSIDSLTSVWHQACKSIGATGIMADLTNKISRLDWNGADVVQAARDIISNTASLDYDIRTYLLEAISSDPDQYVTAVVNLFNGVKNSWDDADETGHPQPDLNVTIEGFSWGIVGGAIVGLLDVAASVATVVGGVVAKVIGIGWSVGRKIFSTFSNLDKEAAGLNFKVHGGHTVPCFDFVTNYCDNYESQVLDNVCSTLKATKFTISSEELPVVGFVTKLSNGKFYIEEHLSANFSIMSVLRPAETYDIISGGKYYGPNDNFALVMSSGWIVCINTAWEGAAAVARSAYRPIKLEPWSSFSNLFDDHAQDIWTDRLCSAMFLYSLWFSEGNINYCISRLLEERSDLEYVKFYAGFNSSPSPWSLQILGINGLIRIAEACENNGVFENSPGSEYLSNYLTSLASKFNQLHYKQEGPFYPIGNCLQIYSVDLNNPSSSSTLHQFTLTEINNSNLVIRDVDKLQYGLTVGLSENLPYSEHFDKYVRPFGTFKTGIAIPSVTLDGYILGAIATGFLVAGTIALVVAGVAITFAVKNYRARLQAKAEAKWYAYEDLLANDQSSSGELKQSWKDYKSAKLKYNFTALLTGGTLLGAGLYDETSTISFDTLSSITTPTLDSEEPVTLNDIVTLIKG